MVKCGGIDHPATIVLAQGIGVPPIFAAGVGVGFLDFTRRHFPNGDLSRLAPTVLAAALGYPGDAVALWHALEKAGFLQEEEGEGVEVWTLDPWEAGA